MRQRGKTRHSFRSEADLCSAFLAIFRREYAAKWVAYAETEGWDILLVRRADGFQIGIQAKLTLNIAVVNQCLADGQSAGGVDPTAAPSWFLNRAAAAIGGCANISASP